MEMNAIPCPPALTKTGMYQLQVEAVKSSDDSKTQF